MAKLVGKSYRIRTTSNGNGERLYIGETYEYVCVNRYGEVYTHTETYYHPMTDREYLDDVKYAEATHRGSMEKIFDAYADYLASRKW